MTRNRFVTVLFMFALAGGLALASRTAEAPLEPSRFGGMLRLDALGALFALLLTATALAQQASGGPALRRILALGALLISLSLSSLLAPVGGLLLACLCLERGRPQLVSLLLACALLAGGFFLIGTSTDLWRYNLPTIGLGLSSPAFALLLAATLIGTGLWRTPLDRASPAPDPLLLVAWVYPLLRLFSLGPWNLGWSLATMLIGAALALWSAWRAATADAPLAWRIQSYSALALVGAGLASGAGVALATFALICVPLLNLAGDKRVSEVGAQDLGVPKPNPQPLIPNTRLALWLLTPAFPLGIPFVTIWLGVGAASAGGSSLLAATLWAVGLIGAAPLANRLARPARGWPLWLASGLSFGLGVLAPLLVQLLIQPVIAQLQGGLSPYGDLGLWPWAGLFALDAARQPIATLPSLALAVLMLVLSAVAWLAVRLWGIARHSSGE